MRSLQAIHRPSPPEAPPGKISVGSLPDELLCGIFRLVQSSYKPYRAWCRVLWVCRRWSAVCRADAFLWRDITVRYECTPNKSFIVASLEYSKNALLAISLYREAYLAEILPLLSPHICRIRSLNIGSGQDSTSASALATFLSNAFPSLESFEEGSQPGETPLVWQPDASDYPRLRYLTLEGALPIKVAPTAVFPALRRLELYHNNPFFTFRSFTQFLSGHPYLEELELYEYDLALDCPFATVTFPPTIRTFCLNSYDRKYIKEFLSSFTHIPAHVCLSILGEYDRSSTGNDQGDVVSATHMLPDPPQRHLHTLSRVTSVEITGDGYSEWTFVGRAFPGDKNLLVKFELFWPWDGPYSYPPRQLIDVVQVFGGAPVVEVRLTNSITREVPKVEWVALLDAFPLLEHVAIEDIEIGDEDDARQGFFEALSEPPQGGGPRWPRLRRFTVVCRNCAASFISLLPRALQVRAEQGTKVDQLHFFVVSRLDERGQRDKGPGEDMVNKLVSWFEEVTWKGLVNDARLDFELTYT